MSYSKLFNPNEIVQTSPIPGREKEQVKNSAGGYSFQVTPWMRLKRFLIIGSDGGTYYISKTKLTEENGRCVLDCLKENGERVVNEIIDVSHNGKAPKNDPAIFALALACANGDTKTKALAYSAIPKVCRTGTHIFQFCEEVSNLRGWSRGLRTGVAKYYTQRKPSEVEYHLVKYRQRNGWTHRDVLRLTHPTAKLEEMNQLFRYAVGKEAKKTPYIEAFEKLQYDESLSSKKAIELIMEYRLPHEAIPDRFKNKADIWEALLHDMPFQALLTNLNKLAVVGLTKTNLDAATQTVVQKLRATDEVIKKARIHPLKVLFAMKTYSQGHGFKGSLTWEPVPAIVDELDSLFYRTFDHIEPTNKPTMLALDVSGSMSCAMIANSCVSAREASTAMAMVTTRTEPKHAIMAFSDNFMPLNISPKQRLDDICRKTDDLPFQGTDCALPMLYALEKKLEVHCFQVYTDSETWAGRIHPTQALEKYRRATGIPARLCVVGMCSNNFTIADPKDGGMMDIVGFDPSAPQVMADFVRGEI